MAARDYVSVVEADALLEGPERLPMAATELEVVWTPGHSPGHCCFYWPARRVVFSADHLLAKNHPNNEFPPPAHADPLGPDHATPARPPRLPARRGPRAHRGARRHPPHPTPRPPPHHAA